MGRWADDAAADTPEVELPRARSFAAALLREECVKKRKSVLIVLEMARQPACGSCETGHRAVRCRICQRIYAQRKRSAARGGLTRRRRYRRNGVAKPTIRDVKRAPAGRYYMRKCGSTASAHRARSCVECRRLWNQAYYVRLCAKRRALEDAAAKQLSGEEAIAGDCEFCGAVLARKVAEESDFGTLSIFACNEHEIAAQKTLADRVAERFYESGSPRRTIADVLDEASPFLTEVPDAILAELEERASLVFGMRIDKASPLFRARFAQLVRTTAASLPKTT